MATRGYPKTTFEIDDQTFIPEIETSQVYVNVPIIMATFTSDKGNEDWGFLSGLTNFTNNFGGISFEKHGQPQLIVAEVLRNGGLVFGKRMVSSNATLANATIRARVVESDGVSYVYTYATSASNVGTIETAAEVGYNNYNFDDTDAMDFPLFTIAAKGRGASNLFFRIVPEYSTTRTSVTLKYSIEIWENAELLNSIVFTINPDCVIDDVSQDIQSRVNGNSSQVNCKMFEDGIYGLARCLCKTATLDGESISVATLLQHDMINGKTRRGNAALGGVIAGAASDDSTDEWTANMPSDIETFYTLSDPTGVPLSNGSYGDSGSAPITNETEYNQLLLGAWGKNTTSEQYDPIIYDVDAFKPDCVLDSNYSFAVKNAIIDVCDFRGDMVFLADLGKSVKTLAEIVSASEEINYSRLVAIYHNWFRVINPYTKKEITVTMPYLLAGRMVKHIDNGVCRPFAGLTNNVYFPEIISGSINFLPTVTPAGDQKQTLVDNCVNYISLYDGTPVMETVYTNQKDYTQLSFLNNIMAVQEVMKAIRTQCPRSRYKFMDGQDFDDYLDDANAIVRQFNANFKRIELIYTEDEKYSLNKIFYAELEVVFHDFVQEEHFKVIALNN